MKTFLFQLLLTAALTAFAAAQETTTTTTNGNDSEAGSPDEAATRLLGTGGIPAFLEPYDVDQDNHISTEENQAYRVDARRRRASGRAFDTNGDGVLSPEEKEAAREEIRNLIEQRRIARFRDEDKDGSDSLSLAEFKNIPAVARLDETIAEALFNRLDIDDDSSLSLLEFLVHLEAVRPIHPPQTDPESPTTTLPRDTSTDATATTTEQEEDADSPGPAPPAAPLRGPSSRLPSDNP